jgi:hypothetical protein
MTATDTKLTKVQDEALRNLYAGRLPFCRSAQTHNALSRAGLIDFESGHGWVVTNAGLDAIGVEVSAEEEGLPVASEEAAPAEEGGSLVPVAPTPDSNAQAPQGTYETELAKALEGGFPELLAHKVAEIRARRESGSEPRTFTVIYTGMGEPIVHRAGCAHNLRDSLAGAHATEDITGTLEDVGRAVYSDMLEEGSMNSEDCIPNLRIKPCAR